MKTIYALAQKINICHGHNDNNEETHIIPKDAYYHGTDFYPMFESEESAKEFLLKLPEYDSYKLFILPLNLLP